LLRNQLRNFLFTTKEFIRKVTRVSEKSLSVVMPVDIIDKLKIREKQKLIVRRSGKKIIIEDWKK